MKKFTQISVVVLLVFAVAVMAFTATNTSSAMAAREICPSVGWNSRSFSCLSALPLSGTDALAYRSLPGGTLDVGWNS
jgi:hypothetical protein